MKSRIKLLIPALSAAFFAAPLAISLLGACGDGADSTTGKRVTLGARIEADSLTFTNGYAWNVKVERALVSVGPLRYLEGAVVARREPVRSDAPARWFTVGTAHAHPGHYEEGGTIGEMLLPASVDLALGPTDLAAGAGISGTALSARFSFQSPPEGEYSAELGTSVAIVEGVATQGAESRPFRASASLEDVLEAGAPAVVGCQLRNGSVQSDGVVTLDVHLSIWLDQVDFALVPASTDGTKVAFAQEQNPHRAFVRGLKKAAAYTFSYAPGSAP
jgi:hypothetical protein